MNDKLDLQITRMFHPVGQGAFFMEDFEWYDDKEKVIKTSCVVYDCGSGKSPYGNSKKGFSITKYVETTLLEEKEIEAVFISHLDTDHCNGLAALLRHCNVKHLFLPMMTESEKVISLITFLSRYSSKYWSFSLDNDFIVSLIIAPEYALSNLIYGKKKCQLHFIENNILTHDTDENFYRSVYINDLKNYETIKSGQPLILLENDNSNTIKWVLIPYNYEYTKRQDLFSTAILNDTRFGNYITPNGKVNYEKIVNEIKNNMVLLENLVDCYRKLPSGTNGNSMLLFSGCLSSVINSTAKLKGMNFCDKVVLCRLGKGNNKVCVNENQCQFANPLKKYEIEYKSNDGFPVGCLYTGDFNAKQIKPFWCKENFIRYVDKFVGIYQQPHHGAESCFDASLLIHHLPKITFYNYGITNSYAHPRTCSVVKNVEFATFHVTNETELEQIIKIHV